MSIEALNSRPGDSAVGSGGEFSESLELVVEEQVTPSPFSVSVKGSSRGGHT